MVARDDFSAGPEGPREREDAEAGHGSRYMEIELRALLRNELPGTLVSFDDKLLATSIRGLAITHPRAVRSGRPRVPAAKLLPR